MPIAATTGLKFYMSKGTTPATITATAVSNAKPALVTCASTAGMKDGQLVTVALPSMPSIDKKSFIVGGLTGTTFQLIGSDSSGDTAAASGTFTYYDKAIDMVPLCLANIGFTQETSSPIATPNFCDPSAAVSGPPPTAPQLTLGFYIDATDAGYCELLKAEEDTLIRMFQLALTGGNGDVVMTGQVNSVILTEIPVEGAVMGQAEVTLSSKAMHRFICP